ncbi:MAG: hypothetical protein JXB29_03195 [Sedimentisphaerales bacterium]|nr:hypothetical protein [Sedimentisphaerales bacterium]
MAMPSSAVSTKKLTVFVISTEVSTCRDEVEKSFRIDISTRYARSIRQRKI